MRGGFRRFSGKADMRRFQTLKAYLFLFPFLAFFIVVTAYPVLFGGYLSLFGQRGAKMWFVGLSNFKSALADPLFWQGFGFPAFLLLVQVPGMIVIAIFIGLLYERVRHSALYRLIFYLPYAVPGVVAGILWSYIFSKSMSPLVALWKLFGVAKPEFITLSSVRWVLLIIILWEWTGFTSLVIYSALVSIPKEYAEAAEMDGATWLKVAYYIKVPLLQEHGLRPFHLQHIRRHAGLQRTPDDQHPPDPPPELHPCDVHLQPGVCLWRLHLFHRDVPRPGRGHIRRLLLLHEAVHEGTGRPCVKCGPSGERRRK